MEGQNMGKGKKIWKIVVDPPIVSALEMHEPVEL